MSCYIMFMFYLFTYIFVLVNPATQYTDQVIFPDSKSSFKPKPAQPRKISPTRNQPSKQPREIPLSMIEQLNSITDEKQLYRDFVEGGPEVVAASVANVFSASRSDTVSNRFGGSSDDGITARSRSTLTAKPAGCQTEERTVSLRDSPDPTLFYFPSCTRINQCGGCCSHDLLTCQPTAIEYLNFSVVVTQYGGGNKLEYKGKKIVTVQQHAKCKCDCTLKEKDCTSLQEYRKNECRCVCTNTDEEAKCAKNSDKKLWNPSNCSCQCREIRECSTGYYFDNITCNCVSINRRPQQYPGYNNLDQTRYQLDYFN